ncbi:hypothetical protein Desku_0748 [Desulfofundulus kuznetsovii DSM 6115]|uniref:Uncharacterized protein n=1 Tax=Desulfofundulus kuznetsovii (strain DSM 6115 / VKM B-1805 / 17) TaxID=760568 RepID=A0AAU8P882_DESK7|nr:hypothetical protein Desku_0748 [Desulfofundulus kuznetsovii DSM 6115]
MSKLQELAAARAANGDDDNFFLRMSKNCWRYLRAPVQR